MRCLRLFLFVLLLLRPFSAEGATIVVGNAMLADIVKDLVPSADIVVLVAPSSCPGHGDASSVDLRAVAKADAVVIAGWQLSVGPIRRTLDASGIAQEKVKVVDVRGSWLVPDVQGKASERTAGILAAAYPEQAPAIVERLVGRLLVVEDCIEHLQRHGSALKGVPVICAHMQRDFLQNLGMRVVGEYGRAEEMSISMLRTLVTAGRSLGVRMVVDNIQSGQNVGRPVSEELGVPRVILSNFPDEAIGCPTYIELFMRSFAMLAEALGEEIR